jgi:hypothetical protein
MTQIAAICIALLKGEVLTIGSGFSKFHCTNLPRELSRSVEQKFGVEISKDKTAFKSKYDEKPGYYFRYRLNRTPANAEGIAKMTEYCVKQSFASIARTKKEAEEKQVIEKLQLF